MYLKHQKPTMLSEIWITNIIARELSIWHLLGIIKCNIASFLNCISLLFRIMNKTRINQSHKTYDFPKR